MVERGGARIAIVGATTPGSMVWDRDNLAGRLIIRDIVPALRTAVAEARGAGANVVLVTMHSGLDEPSSYDTVATGMPSENVAALVALNLTDADMSKRGQHPELGEVTLGQLLATWVVHDLDHVGQIARTMAKVYGEAVGPWREYLSILQDRE